MLKQPEQGDKGVCFFKKKKTVIQLLSRSITRLLDWIKWTYICYHEDFWLVTAVCWWQVCATAVNALHLEYAVPTSDHQDLHSIILALFIAYVNMDECFLGFLLMCK